MLCHRAEMEPIRDLSEPNDPGCSKAGESLPEAEQCGVSIPGPGGEPRRDAEEEQILQGAGVAPEQTYYRTFEVPYWTPVAPDR